MIRVVFDITVSDYFNFKTKLIFDHIEKKGKMILTSVLNFSKKIHSTQVQLSIRETNHRA